MPNQHKETGIKFLSKLHKKIYSIEPSESEPLQTLSESTQEFDGFLNTIYDAINLNNSNENIDENMNVNTNEQTLEADVFAENIDSILRKFKGTKDALENITIFDYWQKKCLFNLSCISWLRLYTLFHLLRPQ